MVRQILCGIHTKNGHFRYGITLAKGKIVKWRLTYKELSVMLGILVALIIVFVIWMRQKPNTEFPVSSRLKMPSVSVPAATKTILKKALSGIKF